jgi:hypothetical protein
VPGAVAMRAVDLHGSTANKPVNVSLPVQADLRGWSGAAAALPGALHSPWDFCCLAELSAQPPAIGLPMGSETHVIDASP